MRDTPSTPYQWKQWVKDREQQGRCLTPAMIRDQQHAERLREAREAETGFTLPFDDENGSRE